MDGQELKSVFTDETRCSRLFVDDLFSSTNFSRRREIPPCVSLVIDNELSQRCWLLLKRKANRSVFSVERENDSITFRQSTNFYNRQNKVGVCQLSITKFCRQQKVVDEKNL